MTEDIFSWHALCGIQSSMKKFPSRAYHSCYDLWVVSIERQEPGWMTSQVFAEASMGIPFGKVHKD